MKMQNKTISILLCAVLLFGMIPVSAATVSEEIVCMDDIGTSTRPAEMITEECYVSEPVLLQTEYTESVEEATLPAYNNQLQTTASLDTSVYYGRSALAKMSNAKVLLYAYDQIAAGVEASSESITIYDGVNAITKAELKMAYDAYYYDYSQHFWLGNSYSIGSNSVTATRILPSYTMSGAELTAARQKFDGAVDEILAGITEDMTEYEKELYLHDTIAAMAYYDEGTNAHNAYGALVEGVAVCEGYAEALQCLLHRVGIQSHIVTGYAGGPHAWNLVRIDGQYYHVDLTWNDQDTNLYHAYFNLTDAMIQKDHTIYARDYGLPTCTATDAFYFSGKDTYLQTYTVAQVAKLLQDNDLRVHVYLPNGKDAFYEWYCANIGAIAGAAGVRTGFSYGFAYDGGEAILYLVNIDVKLTDGDSVTYYQTFANAVPYMKDGCKLCLLRDLTTNISSSLQLTLDLNGFDVNGSVTGANLVIYDSQTDDYTVSNGNGYGVITGTVTGASTADGYIKVIDGGTSYHKVDVALDKLVLKSAQAGLYYTGSFLFDEIVAESLQAYGVAISTENELPVADDTDSASLYTTSGNSVLVKNIMSAGNTASANNANANKPVYARAYLKLADGTLLYSEAKTSNLKTMVEAVDAGVWSKLSQTQKAALTALYQTYSTAMSTWDIPNLKNA